MKGKIGLTDVGDDEVLRSGFPRRKRDFEGCGGDLDIRFGGGDVQGYRDDNGVLVRIIVVDGDPLDNFEVLGNIIVVIKNGEIAYSTNSD